jgi:hypothetical protein
MRPSHKELTGKIRQAKEAVAKGAILIINASVVAADAIELGYDIKELQTWTMQILDQIDPGNYTGRRPPERSYEREIKGLDLYVFRLFFTPFGCEIYLKFALSQGHFWLVSLHQNRGGGSHEN